MRLYVTFSLMSSVSSNMRVVFSTSHSMKSLVQRKCIKDAEFDSPKNSTLTVVCSRKALFKLQSMEMLAARGCLACCGINEASCYNCSKTKLNMKLGAVKSFGCH